MLELDKKEYNNLVKQYNNINNELDSEIENLIYLLENIEIESINLYSIYLKINDLIYNKKMIQNKLNIFKIENNITDSDYYELD